MLYQTIKNSLLEGFYTILLTSSGVLIGLIIGLFLGIGKLSKNKFINIPAKIYVTVFRGTPLFVQILIIHFAVIPSVFNLMGAEVPGPVFRVLQHYH